MGADGFVEGRAGYAEIGAASHFSFLRGASKPEEMVLQAAEMGLGGLGLADRNTVAGVVRAYGQAREQRTPFRPGARLVFADGTPDVFAYPRKREGWGRLCRLLTEGNRRGGKGACELRLADLLEWGEGISLAVLAPGALGSAASNWEAAERCLSATLLPLREAFPGAVRLGVAPRLDGLDARRLARAARLAKTCRTPLLATADALFHAAERRPLADVVAAIREHVPLSEAGFLLSRNAERRLKTAAEMARLFSGHPNALEEAARFFAELRFDLRSLRYLYPDEKLKLARTPAEELRLLALAGAALRYPGGVPKAVLDMIEHELAIIAARDYEPYFLTVHRIMEEARRREILCQGRGSAANSVVCFCLGITDVWPEEGSLLFERFISPDRDEPPDIDVDFEHERRDEIIRWIYGEYGRDHAAIAATVITYRARSAAREVGKAFGLSNDAVSALSATVWGYGAGAMGEREAAAAGLRPEDAATANVLRYAAELVTLETPRHLSQHVGGFVLTRDRVDETVPVLPTGEKGRTIVEWDKDDLDELQILKIDVLALGMLSCLRRCFALLAEHYDRPLALATIPMEEPGEPVWRMTHRADTLGVFQIESRAQMTMLPKLRPNCFYDLVIEVAIVRPGPIQGNMVHPYLRRKMGLEKATYPSEALEKVLGRTLGVPLFQEQAMRVAMVAAGFTATEADKLRRAMATFKRTGGVKDFRERMIGGMIANGYDPGFAERCFRQIEGFGSYGFPESHAAAFAVLVYASAWIKCHYPDVFCAALLNAQPMGFYAPAQVVRDAREHGVEIRPVCINASHWDSTLETAPFDTRRIAPRHAEMAGAIETKRAVRLGFGRVKGLAKGDMARLVAERNPPYDSVRDVWLRSGLKRAAIERLTDADAFASLGLTRRDALWAVRALDEGRAAERLPLFADGRADLQGEPEAQLPPMPLGAAVVNDYRFLSLSLKAHPVAFVRDALAAGGVRPGAELASAPSGRRVAVAGLVLVRQRPGSAKGVIFITIEDETGVANVVVWQRVFEQFRPIVLGARFMEVRGRVQASHGVVHVVADTLLDRTPLLGKIADAKGTGLEGVGHMAPADHVRQPLRRHRPARPGTMADRLSPDALDAAAALGNALARGDEVRRNGPGGSVRRPPTEAGWTDEPAAGAVRAVLPKGRNFH